MKSLEVGGGGVPDAVGGRRAAAIPAGRLVRQVYLDRAAGTKPCRDVELQFESEIRAGDRSHPFGRTPLRLRGVAQS
jgi:hypothetical protein